MEHLSKALAAVSRVGEVISRTAQSAQELLRDQELRSKGIQTVITGAQSRLQGIQNGIVQRAGRIQERLLDNRRQLQVLLQSLEDRFNASQRAWQLQARRRDRVDVQFGRQVLEHVPQEIRARLWYVLLENPHLAAPLKCEHPRAASNSLIYDEGVVDDGGEDLLAGAGGWPLTSGGPSSRQQPTNGAGRDGPPPSGQMMTTSTNGISGGITSPTTATTGSRFVTAAAAAFGFSRSTTDAEGNSLTGSPSAVSLNSPTPTRRERSITGKPSPGVTDATSEPAQTNQQQPLPLLPQQQPYAATTPQSARGLRGTGPTTPIPTTAAAAAAEVASAATSAAAVAADGAGDSLDGWELVSGVLGTTDTSGLPGSGGPPQGSGAASSGAPQPEAIRIILERLDALGHLALDESGSDPLLVAQQAVLEAMLQVPWESGVGLPPATAPDCRFAVLNEMTAGQEEVDDSILRDIHRTFPEHPYFGMEAGQRSLFRVLKAYSLHDLEVAYCQGMAFMAGVLLMYVPEETAFRLFCRLMDPEGPNLRRLYLPGLEPLKAELATFELLLTWRLPELATHLSEFGLPPVLYVSQWLMTLFATPFPPAFCARVIDVLLQDGHDRLLLRCSYAVVEALEQELLTRHDFEALITYLKMEPVTWGLTRQRAIMERALTSPLTDAEIDIARDTVANRKFLAAALAASAAAGTASRSGAGGEEGAGPNATAGDDLLGSTVVDAGARDPAAVMHQRKRSLEEVDASLTIAAAAALTSTEGISGCSNAAGVEGFENRDRGYGGGGAEGFNSGIKMGAVAGTRTARGVREGSNDMISFDEEGPSTAAAAAAAVGHRYIGDNGVCRGSLTASPPGGGGWEPEWPPVHVTSEASGHRVVGVDGAGRAGCSGGGGGTTRMSYGMSPSLLDDLDFGCGSGTAAQRRKLPELEYGEYGEMLMDAGILLPELDASATAVDGPAAAAAAVPKTAGAGIFAAGGGSGGDELFTPLHGLRLEANPQRRPGQVPSGSDLLLD